MHTIKFKKVTLKICTTNLSWPFYCRAVKLRKFVVMSESQTSQAPLDALSSLTNKSSMGEWRSSSWDYKCHGLLWLWLVNIDSCVKDLNCCYFSSLVLHSWPYFWT